MGMHFHHLCPDIENKDVKQSHMWVSLHACVHPLRNHTNSEARISYEMYIFVFEEI